MSAFQQSGRGATTDGASREYARKFQQHVSGFANDPHAAVKFRFPGSDRTATSYYQHSSYSRAKYRQIVESGQLGQGQQIDPSDYVSAYTYAMRHPGFVFRLEKQAGSFGGTSGILYDIRKAQPGERTTEIDSSTFTQRTDDFDPSTVTLEQLAEHVKTLQLKLQRAGLI